MALDDVTHCKSTVSEMDILVVGPDDFTREMAARHEGVQALASGFARRAKGTPSGRRRGRPARGAPGREALSQGAMPRFSKATTTARCSSAAIYRHLSNAADRMANCANTLHDIQVKIG